MAKQLAKQSLFAAYERMYLHIDNYGPAKSLYESDGFVANGDMDSEGVTHMVKQLPVVEEELLDDDEDEVEKEEEEEEEDEAVKALPEGRKEDSETMA